MIDSEQGDLRDFVNRRLLSLCRDEVMAVAALVAPDATPDFFSIDGPAEDRFKGLLDKLLRSGLESRLSRDFVDGKVANLIGELALAPSPDKAEEGLKQLWTEFDHAPTFRVIVPLSGFDAPESPLELGKVTIRLFDASACNELTETIATIIDGTAHTDDDKTSLKALVAERLRTHLTGQVIAEAIVAAESTRAIEIAHEETRRSLDAIRYALPALLPKVMRVEIGLMHEVFGGSTLTPLVEQSGKSFVIHGQAVGPLAGFKLDGDAVRTMENLGVFQLGRILAKASPTGLERALIRSLRWFGTTSAPGDASYRLVSGIVCLETILVPGDREPIANYVGESAALLLGTEPAERRRIKARVKELYGIRSAIAHGAAKSPGERDIDDLTAIAGEVIQRVLRLTDQLKTLADLYERLEDLKFA